MNILNFFKSNVILLTLFSVVVLFLYFNINLLKSELNEIKKENEKLKIKIEIMNKKAEVKKFENNISSKKIKLRQEINNIDNKESSLTITKLPENNLSAPSTNKDFNSSKIIKTKDLNKLEDGNYIININ